MSTIPPPGETSGDPLVPWYRSWFGESYLALYPHRDDKEARAAVDLLLRTLRGIGRLPEPGEPVLDLACGAGRHLRALRDHHVDALGMDLSASLLREAGRRLGRVPRVRGDMRHLPFRAGTFTGVTSFFTSFGYFEREEEDLQVLREVRRVLRPGGWLMVDFLNASRVRAELRPRDVRRVGGRVVEQERRLVEGGRRVEKRIRIVDEATGQTEEFLERVRLYEARELDHLLATTGFLVEARFGGYDGRAEVDEAPRRILLATLPLDAPPISPPARGKTP